MDLEDRDKFEKVISLAEDNNRMIKKLYRALRWSRVFRVIYLVIIIGASLGSYYYIQPYLESLGDTYGGIKDAISGLPGIDL
jgi:hypothetical protein